MVAKSFGSILVVAGLCVAATACGTPPKTKEDRLSSSGFKAMPLKTPAQLASFRSLPAHKLTKTTYKGETAWVYADPTICACLYVGNQDAYNAYSKKVGAIEARDAQAAMESMNWDYSPWVD